MCGIAGYIGKRKFNNKLLNQISSSMDHRGPDAKKFVEKKMKNNLNIIFFHNRLSIIDLHQRSNQPMEYEENLLSFNGEIYNFHEIQKHLIQSYGLSFNSKSDTEVLLKGLSKKGIQLLNDLDGMWAFAFFDKMRDTIMLSRDRIGEKPLYYHKNADGFYFASEITTLFLMMGRNAPLNIEKINQYLIEGYVSIFGDKKTFFDGINELQPGEYFILDKNLNIKKNTYWSLKYKPQDMTYNEAVIGVKEKFINAVNSRLISDTPVCILLSGGIDSTSIASVAKNVLGKNLPSFSILNSDPKYSEIDIIKKTVKELSLEHHEINIKLKNPTVTISKLIKHYASPMGSVSNLLNLKLYDAISKYGYKVSLMGTGGDEALTGYYEHYIFDLVEKDQTKLFDVSEKNFLKYVLPKLNNPHLKKYREYIKNPDKRDHLFPNKKIFSNCLKNEFNNYTEEKKYSQSVLRNRMMNLLFHQGVRLNLSEIDLNSMYYSIENRAPLLDKSFLEFCYTIPNNLLIKNGYTKSILRDAMKGIAPSHVLEARDKHSLNVSLANLYDVKSKKFSDYLFKDDILYDLGLLNIENTKNILNNDILDNEIEKFLFRLINIKEFTQIYG